MKPTTIELKGKRYNYFLLGKGKKTIIMLHGLAADKCHMSCLMDLCPTKPFFKGYRCLIPDLFGHNDIAIYGKGTADDQADYILALIRHLKIRDYALVGFSFGSIVSLKISERTRKKIPLVLWASPLAGVGALTRFCLQILSSMPFWLYRLLTNTPLVLPVGKILSPKNAVRVIQSAQRFDNRLIKTISFDPDEIALNSRNPKLFIFGGHDPVIPKIAAKRLMELRPTNAKILTLDHAGHASTDTGNKAALDVIRAFLYENF
jgi:pimeloyl-ACP methyl ester carboxylesterase